MYYLFQITASDQTRVVIDDVQINYSGTYMCEVTVSPTFDALIQFANMTVVGKLNQILCMWYNNNTQHYQGLTRLTSILHNIDMWHKTIQ